MDIREPVILVGSSYGGFVALALAIPFAVSGRWGLIGVGFNNDLGLHLAWAEWLRSGFGPTPEAGYPLGPHALATTVAAVPGIGLGTCRFSGPPLRTASLKIRSVGFTSLPSSNHAWDILSA